MRQNGLSVKICYKKQRRSLNNKKRSIYKENVTISNIYVSSTRASKHTRQLLTELKTRDSNTIIIGDFNFYLQQWIDHTDQNQNETIDLNNTIHQMANKYIQNIPSEAAKWTFFSSTHGTFFRIRSYVKPQNRD